MSEYDTYNLLFCPRPPSFLSVLSACSLHWYSLLVALEPVCWRRDEDAPPC